MQLKKCLDGRVATVTGASSGIGRAAAMLFAREGAHVGLTRVLVAEFGVHGIRVNAILPGGTDTPMGRQVTSTPEARAFVGGLHALKRIASPDEIARSVLHLVSDASRFVTGTAWLVDGGVTMTRT